MGTTQAIFDPGALAEVELPALDLVVQEGPDKGLRLPLRGRSLLLGSDPDLRMPLKDPTVSRRHARLEVTGLGLRLVDLESTNGTWVGDLRIQSAIVPIPGTIRLGSTVVKIEAREGEAPVKVNVYEGDRLAGMVGQSAAMQEVYGLIATVAPTDATVLITGESGTGKELAARALHGLSERREGPFVVFDCSAVPKDLIASELFGHVKGAFTGASSARAGTFRQAQGGTVFLDEIGELSLELQPKLLRLLETHQVKPVGGERTEDVDVRVIAATNRPLLTMVHENSFRQDLYYRLALIEIELPPLRDRVEDIPLLVAHFLEASSGESPAPIRWDTMQKLMAHSWPGNVRELRNYVERAALLSSSGTLDTRFLVPAELDDASPTVPTAGGALPVHYELPFKDAKSRLVEAFERAYWERMLKSHQWNVSAAARSAGIHRKSLEYSIRKLGLERT